MAITALPTPPSRSDPTNFASRGDAFMAALPAFTTEANALAVQMDAAVASIFAGLTDTSVSSVAIGTGAKTFTVSANKGFLPGHVLLFAVTASPSSNQMVGVVTSYNTSTGALVVTVPTGYTLGSGTYAEWTITTSTLAARLDSINTFTAQNTYKAVGFTMPGAIATTTGAVTVNWTTGNNQIQNEPTGTITYTFTSPAAPCHLQLMIASDGTSTAQAINWPASVRWVGLTWSAIANKAAIINFWWDGTYYWAQGANQV